MPKLTSAERGGTKANPKPEAILKYAFHPIAMLAGLWDQLRKEWEENKKDDLDLSPILRQTVKSQKSMNGELTHGLVSTEVHTRSENGCDSAAGNGVVGR
jgi:hypothetical protein